MKKTILTTIFLFFIFILFTRCDYFNRREFCDCMNPDLEQAFKDAFELSKKELEEKAKGCDWIEEELSAQELLEEMGKCK